MGVGTSSLIYEGRLPPQTCLPLGFLLEDALQQFGVRVYLLDLSQSPTSWLDCLMPFLEIFKGLLEQPRLFVLIWINLLPRNRASIV